MEKGDPFLFARYIVWLINHNAIAPNIAADHLASKATQATDKRPRSAPVVAIIVRSCQLV